MLSLVLNIAFPLNTDIGPMDLALRATEAPPSLRAAFTVEMTSAKAERTYMFDPRAAEGERWTLLEAYGEDSALDEAAAAWGAETAPDGRLFPDDLRESLGKQVQVEDVGLAQRIRFQHAPSANDTALDIWATQQLDAEAWLEPLSGRFMRIDYSLSAPVKAPQGGRLTRFEQSYLLETEPVWGLSYISQYRLEFEARGGFRKIAQSYTAVISEATFFFASTELEDAFLAEVKPVSTGALASR